MIPLGKSFLLYMENPSYPGSFRVIAKCRSNSLGYNNATIDVSKMDGTRWRKLLSGGIQSLAISGEGVFSDDVTVQQLRQMNLNNSQALFKCSDGLGNIIICYFKLPTFSEAGPYNKEHSFSFSLNSSGRPYLYTPTYGSKGNLPLASAAIAAGADVTTGLGFPGPAVGFLSALSGHAVIYDPDVYTKVGDFVGSTSGIMDGSTSGIYYKMLGVFNVVTLGSVPTFTSSDGVVAGMVCPDGTAQAFDGSPLTQTGVYLVYGYVNTPLLTGYAGTVGETRHYRVQFNAQDEIFTAVRPGIQFSGATPNFTPGTAPTGSAMLPTRTLNIGAGYSVAISGTYFATHFGAYNFYSTPTLTGSTVTTAVSWNTWAIGPAVGYNLGLFGSITNDDPYPTPPAGAVFGTGGSQPLGSGAYVVNGLSPAGLDLISTVTS